MDAFRQREMAEYLRTGIIASTIANAASPRKRYKAVDFMPKMPAKVQSSDEMLAVFKRAEGRQKVVQLAKAMLQRIAH